MFSRNSNFFLPLEIFGPDISPVDVVDVDVVDVDDDVVDDDVGQEFLRIKSQLLGSRFKPSFDED